VQQSRELLGRSEWRVIQQADANAFGATTHDEQWIHTDPLRAASGPFGRTIAHGYLTLSLATALVDEVLAVTDAVMVVNYGVDRVRFPAPLPLGAEVRAEVGLSATFPAGSRRHSIWSTKWPTRTSPAASPTSYSATTSALS
jgi:acyl dehydratase